VAVAGGDGGGYEMLHTGALTAAHGAGR
jgi:hypothetical protein